MLTRSFTSNPNYFAGDFKQVMLKVIRRHF